MSCGKKNKAVQKVVIPKGMINPGETTIIEIPTKLQKQPIVVAKRKNSLESVNYSGKDKKKNSKYGTDKMQGGAKRAAAATGADLEATERKERDQFLKDLEEFQKARRRLLANASFLAGENNVPGQSK